jgi:cell division protease FtsH
MIINDEEKKVTAVHEAGHALLAVVLPNADPVHKVTIIPRGMALGVTWTMPVEDRYGLNRDQILAQIRHAMGGRAAEDVVFGQFSTGAANDLKQATQLARRMVCSYGMSDRIGPVSFAEDEHDVFLGRDFVQRKDYSEKKAEEIDDEVSRLLRGLYAEARQLLADHRDALDRISTALLERETLESEELKLLVEGKPLPALPRPPTTSKTDTHPPRERAPAGASGGFRGDKLPDPEPVPG